MKINNVLLVSFADYQPQAQRLAKQAKLAYSLIELHHFPDGESKVTLPTTLAKHVVLCQSLNNPNSKLIELIMAAEGLKKQGIETLSLVAPYLSYMRQDKAFNQGEVVSQHVIGNLLTHYFDNVLTVDAHLHRISHLAQAISCKKAINVCATEPIANFLNQHIESAFLIGPDAESEQWVSAIAQHNQLDYRIANKIRLGDKSVQINLPKGDYHGRHIVLVDDVASSGKTLLEAASKLKVYQPASISIVVTHALFLGDAIEQLKRVGVKNIWSCDTITHPTNVIILDSFLADNLQPILE